MDPLTQNKLDQLIELTKDNNKMLRKMRRGQVWASVVRAFYWIFIIVSIYGAYRFLGPTFKTLYNTYTNLINPGAQEGSKTSGNLLDSLKDLKDVKTLLEKYNLK